MISVIIPNYNKGDLVWRCLTSLWGQLHTAIEIIFVDDGSTDKSFMLASMFASIHPSTAGNRIVIVRFPERRGPQPCRTFGLTLARGENVIFSDSDCVYPANFLSKLIAGLDSDLEASWAYSGWDRIWLDAKGKTKKCDSSKSKPWNLSNLYETNYISMCSLIRREVIDGHEFDTKIKRFQDWDLWLTLGKKGLRGTLVSDNTFRIYATEDGISSGVDGSWEHWVRVLKEKHGF